MHWFPQNRRRKFPFWTMPHHHFYVCVPPIIIKRKNRPMKPINILKGHPKAPPHQVHSCLQTFVHFQSRRTIDRTYNVLNPPLLNCLFLLHELWRPVDHVLVAVATPDLPPSILLLSNYNPRSEHHQIPSYGYQRRTSLEGDKIVPPKLISPIWHFDGSAACCKGTHSHRWWWRMGEHTQMQAATFRITCNQLRPTMTINHPSKH